MSYSHQDRDWANDLRKHLEKESPDGTFKVWADTEIMPGADWDKGISKELESCSVFLLLLSSNYLSSNYCYGTELQGALDRSARGDVTIIPIVLKDCDWSHSPLAHMKTLPEGAISLASRQDRDEALQDFKAQLIKQLKSKPLLPKAAAGNEQQ